MLDIGSNAARFVLARIVPGSGYRVLRRARVVTRLAGGKPGTLPRKGVKAVLRGTHRFLQEVRNGAEPRVIAVATAAVRDAENSRRLLGPLERKEGVEVEILSGRQEARLGALAALRSLPITDGAIADLGGGSLQLSRVRRGEILSTSSAPLGAVRVTRQFFKHDPPTSKELRRLRREVREQLLDALPATRRGELLIGMGGTVRTIASMHLAAVARPPQGAARPASPALRRDGGAGAPGRGVRAEAAQDPGAQGGPHATSSWAASSSSRS